MNMQKLALALSLTLAATACGGSSSPEEAAPDEVTTTTEATTTTESPVDVDRYCELAVANDTETDAFFGSEDVLDPVAFEAFAVGARASLVEAIAVADPKVAAPLALILEQVGETTTVLETHGYDIIAASEELDMLDDSRYDDAEAAIEAYDEEICGIAPDEDDETEAIEEVEEDPAMEEEGEAAAPTQEEIDQAQQIVDFMKTPEGLALAVQGFRAEAPGVSEEQAGCFLATVTAEQFIQFSSLADAADVDLADPAVAEIFTLMLACDISIADLTG